MLVILSDFLSGRGGAEDGGSTQVLGEANNLLFLYSNLKSNKERSSYFICML